MPVQVKLPVAPSIVQPVAPEPPAKLMEAAVAPLGPMFNVEAEPPKLIVVAVSLSKLKVEAVVFRVLPWMASVPEAETLPEESM